MIVAKIARWELATPFLKTQQKVGEGKNGIGYIQLDQALIVKERSIGPLAKWRKLPRQQGRERPTLVEEIKESFEMRRKIKWSANFRTNAEFCELDTLVIRNICKNRYQ